MYSKETMIKNPTGLHARPASDFVAAAAKFESKVIIRRTEEPEEEANAKSIIMLLSLGLGQGEEISIAAKGPDEVNAVDELIALVEGGFGEI